MIKLTTPFAYTEYARVNGNQGRCYDVNMDRPLPSVTTILSATSDKEWLENWRQAIGEEKADAIVKESSEVGDRLHLNLEEYILTGAKPQGNLLTKLLTDKIIKEGLSKIDEVWGTEVMLFKKHLYAGTTDLVGVHQGIPSIMDFKNSRQDKTADDIEDYFLQLAAYAEAHNEMYGTTINRGVILMGCWSGRYKEFIIEGEEFDHYTNLWYEKCYQFYETYGI